MKKYLVPVDFSVNAKKAIEAAKFLAKIFSARLYILHAYQPYVPDPSLGPAGLSPSDELENVLKDNLQSYVDELIAEGFEAEGIWGIGTVAEVVRESAEQVGADLVVVGRTGKGGFWDKLFGTSARGIVKASPVPVLVIPPQTESIAFREIVYATQLEREERNIINQVLKLARHTGGRIIFLKINSLTQPDIQDDNQFIEDITGSFGFSTDDFVVREAGSVVGGIEKAAEELEADILIVATRSRGFLEELLVDPSITPKLIVSSKVPLLIYHLD